MAGELNEAQPIDQSITLMLPADILAAIRQRAQQSGASPKQVLIAALRSGLHLNGAHDPNGANDLNRANDLNNAAVAPLAPSQPQWQEVMQRLAALEALLPTVKALEAKLEHRLQLEQTHEDESVVDRPDLAAALEAHWAAVPSAVESSAAESSAAESSPIAVLDHCPKCNHRLGPPLKASGRQVCGRCGWSNKPRRAMPDEVAGDVAPDDLQKIVAQAAQESLINMKPKKAEKPKGINRLIFGKE